MKICIASLQYSPVFKTHSFAIGHQLKAAGHEVFYLLSEEYAWMLNKEEKSDEVFFIGHSKSIITSVIDSINFWNYMNINRILKWINPDYIYFQNIHPTFNYYISRKLIKKSVQVIQHIHEPYVLDKKAYGVIQQRWLYLFELLQEALLKKINIAILSSMEAVTLFNIRYPSHTNKIIKIPLMYEDCISQEQIMTKRRYITFIGPLIPEKGSKLFLDLMSYCSDQGINHKFLLLSKSSNDIELLKPYKNLTTVIRDNISDSEFFSYICESILVLTPYTSARQSSAVLTSFMCGTPVLSSNVGGLGEAITDKETGILIELNSPLTKWIEGIDFIENDFVRLRDNCRRTFESKYSENNWPSYFHYLFGETC